MNAARPDQPHTDADTPEAGADPASRHGAVVAIGVAVITAIVLGLVWIAGSPTGDAQRRAAATLTTVIAAAGLSERTGEGATATWDGQAMTTLVPGADAYALRTGLDATGWTADDADTAFCLNMAFDAEPLSGERAAACALIDPDHDTAVTVSTDTPGGDLLLRIAPRA